MSESKLSDEIKLGVYADCSIDDQLKVTLSKPESLEAKPLTISREDLHRSHIHVRGKTRSGKTSRLLIPLAQQLMLPYGKENSEKDCLIFIDLGGDENLFRTAKSEAENREKGKRKFRFISLNYEDDWSTFDPFQAIAQSSRTAINLAEYLIAAMSLDYGLVYGGSWYTQANLNALLLAAKEMERSGSSSCLESVVEAISNNTSHRDGEQIKMMLRVLLEFVQLQDVEGVERIDLARAINDGEVIYFYMPSIVGANSARQIAGLGLYGIIAAAMERHRKGANKRHVFVFVDEFQEIAGRAFSSLLAQTAKYGVSLILANQTTNQLVQRDFDLASMVSDNTSIKIYYTITTQEDLEALQLFSNDKITQMKSESTRQESDFGSFSSREVVTPTLEKNVILEVSASEGYALAVIDNGHGHQEPIPIYTEYGLAEDIHREVFTIPQRESEVDLQVNPAVGVHKPYVPNWKKDHSDDEQWQERQNKLQDLWKNALPH